MLTENGVFFAFQLAVFSYVFTVILTKQGMIFEWYYDLLVGMKRQWIAKPLGACTTCFSGQAALWVWLYFKYDQYTGDIFAAFLEHVLFISVTILFSVILNKSISKWLH